MSMSNGLVVPGMPAASILSAAELWLAKRHDLFSLVAGLLTCG